MPVTPQITITGTLNDLFGELVNSGSLVFQLCGFGSAVPRVFGTALLARTSPLKVACPVGVFSTLLWGNDVIVPANSYYTVQILDDNGNVIQTNAYQFSGSGSFDLSTVTPYDPETPAPPTPVVTVTSLLVTVPYSATPVFDCSLVDGPITFDMELTGDVTAPTLINNFPGQQITFIFAQDVVGGRLVAWPANVRSAEVVDPTASAVSIQSFISRVSGNAYPIGPMTIN